MPELVCIACPIGCRLTAEKKGDEEVIVQGNRCPRGLVYGTEELLSPKRMVTAVVRTDSPSFPYVPVRTAKPFPRSLIDDLLSELSGFRVALPTACGGVLVRGFRGTGVDIIFSRTLPPDEVPPVG